MLFQDLAPLITPARRLYLAKHAEVEALVPATAFDKSEEEAIRDYDSGVTRPDLIFLGVDEHAAPDAPEEPLLEWKTYRGRPFFALDVSERGDETQRTGAAELVKTLEAQGVTPWLSRHHTDFSPDEGW